MSRCKCPRPIERLEKRGAFARAFCQQCGGHVRVASASFDFDLIDWDEERLPAGAPYAGRTYKEVATLNPAFVRWYAENVHSRIERDIASRAVRELTL